MPQIYPRWPALLSPVELIFRPSCIAVVSQVYLRRVPGELEKGRQMRILSRSSTINMDRTLAIHCQCSLVLLLVIRYIRRKRQEKRKKCKRKFWVGPMLRERSQHGQYHTLFAELRLNDREYFFR